MKKIGFFINKNNCYVYGVDSHGVTTDKPTLIFKNGDEYHFEGSGRGNDFYYKKNTIAPVDKKKIKEIICHNELEKELYQALKRYGFREVILSK